jgi:hypothetical protein
MCKERLEREQRRFGRSQPASLNLHSPTYTLVSESGTTCTHHTSVFFISNYTLSCTVKTGYRDVMKYSRAISRVNAELKIDVLETSSVCVIREHMVNAHTLLIYVCANLIPWCTCVRTE